MSYSSVSVQDLVLAITDIKETPIAKQRYQVLIYLIDRKSVTETNFQITSCTYTKYSRGPNCNQISSAIKKSIESDLLYDNEQSESITIDYYSEFEENISDIPTDIINLVTEIVQDNKSKSLLQLQGEVKNYSEVDSCEKYSQIQLQKSVND